MPRRRVNERAQARAAQFAAVLSEILHAQLLAHREIATALGISRFTVDSWTRAGDPALPGEENFAQLCSFLDQRQSGLGTKLATAAQFDWTPAGTRPAPFGVAAESGGLSPTGPKGIVASTAVRNTEGIAPAGSRKDSAAPPGTAMRESRTNLPAALTSFVGRASELAEVRHLLSTTRLLTLMGVGGVGKTRLALEVAHQLKGAYSHGVWLVELAALTDPNLIWQVTAAVLDAQDQPGTAPNEALRLFLWDKHVLIILDNCEHLVAACAQFADALLKTCPRLELLATSREALSVAGEVTYHVPPLDLPLNDEIGRSAAVQLFVARAAAAQPPFAPAEKDLQAIAQICRRLDGLPLALELAAARVRVFSPEQIAQRLDDRFRLLTGGSRTALPRQQTLRAALDWSYDLLSEPEQVLFRRLSVFAGGWSLDAAEAVTTDTTGQRTSESNVRTSSSVIRRENVLDLLSRLVDKSLVGVSDREDGTRFGFLETVREYTHEKLLGVDEADSLRERHAVYFYELAQAIEPLLYRSEQLSGFARLESELVNIRAALEWTLSRRPLIALEMVSALWLFWAFGGHTAEGRRRVGAALSHAEALTSAEELKVRAKALRVLAELALMQGEHATANDASEQSVMHYRVVGDADQLGVALCTRAFVLYSSSQFAPARAAEEESIQLLRQVSDPPLLSYALGTMAQILAASGEYPAAYEYLQESARYAREAGAPFGLGMVLLTLAQLTAQRGDLAGARRQIEESLSVFEGASIEYMVVVAGSALADVARLQGEYAEAKVRYREALAGWRERGLRGAMARCLECLAYIAHAERRDQDAMRLIGAAEALREAAQSRRTAQEEAEHVPILEELRASAGYLAFQAASVEGRAMALEEAVGLALNV
jgi:predicted ATPase